MTDTPDDIIATFGVNPFEIVNRHRAHWIVEKPDEDEIQYNVEPGWLAIRARDGAGNPISVEATRRPNFMATYEDDFDSTYRYYYFAPLPPTSAENARVAQEPVAWALFTQAGAVAFATKERSPGYLSRHNLTSKPLYTADQLDAAVRAERERCATKAHGWLKNWAADLFGTWESYIEAKASGRHNGRRISEGDADMFAKQFRERAEAVDDCADHVAAAIREGE